MVYYGAYGSNTNLQQMGFRCPMANVVGKGVIEGYMLMFRGRINSAVATIQKNFTSTRDKDRGVPVVIWEINEWDEIALDKYEGFPHLYHKEILTVTMEDGTSTKAMAYIMNDGYKVGIPSGHYFNAILDGYEANGIDSEYLFERLQSVSSMIRHEYTE